MWGRRRNGLHDNFNPAVSVPFLVAADNLVGFFKRAGESEEKIVRISDISQPSIPWVVLGFGGVFSQLLL